MENLIYLDEDAVNEELITHHGGKLEETIQRMSRDVSVGGSVEGQAGEPTGLLARLKGAISADYQRGKEKEFVYDLTDEVAKFALLLEVFDASGATEIDSNFDASDRDNLATDAPIMITAPLVRIPIGEIKNQFDVTEELDLLGEGFADLAKSGLLDDEQMEDIEQMQDDIESLGYAISGTKKMFDSLSQDDDIYRTSSSSEADFVMGLPDQQFRNRPRDFPSTSKEYVVIGKIMTKVEKGDSIPFINFAELAEKKVDNPRDQKREETKIKRKVADMADEMLDREVRMSEFELSHPDVQMEPLAIY
ncbi:MULTISPECIES: DUF6414 family protein [Halobacterium]|uniref:DUF6414 family protein n=1 Tax=Halobacterium TaxID=2239 RepID=UPI001965543F|nr:MULTISPECIES: hypothetical protein [Halobacterium]MCF2164697.1 hypothetical protein [Halobacterium salinarum]MCF2166857.1 hypothetical protein [Halobacterium salinarum]MCF2237738.1 hypothetical protein [Halobacterium salinarum]QRY22803.1 hypothetical protein JT689_01875 [Halobacterium sp. GSL-19]WJK64108.1 hypothetical protein QSJ49_02810 [Halobacterium salinarum]